jgi:hypothetical protein
MASDQDIMKLRATVEDDATATIAKIQKAMHAAHQSTKRDQAEHAKHVREQQKAYKELGEATKEFIGGGGIGGAFGGLAGRLGAVGIAIGVAVEAINKASESVKQLGQRSADLIDLSRQANMTTDAFQRLESQMNYLNISKEKADKSMTTFGNRWHDLSSGRPSMKAIGEVEDGDLTGVYERYVKPNLKIKDTGAAMKKIIDDVKNSGQPDYMQARILSQLGIDEGYAYKSKPEIAEAREHERVAVPKETAEQLEKSRQKGLGSDSIWDRTGNAITSSVAPMVDAYHDLVTKGGDSMFGDDDKKKVLKESTTAGTEEGMLQAWREIVMGRTSDAELFAGGYKPMAFHPDDNGGRRGGTFGSKEYPALDPNGSAARALGGFQGGDQGGTPGVSPDKAKIGKGGDPRGMESYIRETAKKYGVDPDTAVAVANSEGMAEYKGDNNTSFGAFQLHTGGGLGDEFKKETGLDPRDPKNERAMIDYTLKNVNKTGWGPYHGAKNSGIGPRAGLDGAASGQSPTSATMRADGLKAFIMHHTGGRGTVAGVQETLRQRGLGVEYVMDRDGNITQTGNRGAANIMPGWGPKGKGLNNSNILGMEVIAKNDRDVTAAQIKAAKAFIDKNYPGLPVYGHGEVNPGHKEADEGMSITKAIREGRENAFTNPQGLGGGGAHMSDRVKHGTHHKLSVDFTNMPKGVRTGYNGQPGLFKEVKLNRGRAMGFASQDS